MVKNGHQQQPARRNTELRREAYRLVAPGAAVIAGHLMRVFQIPSGAELAIYLAAKAPACNATALRYWVRIELARMADSDPVANVLVALEKRLLKHLQALWPDAAGEVEVPSAAALASRLPPPYWESSLACAPPVRGQRPPSLRARNSNSQFMDQQKERRHEKP